PARRPLRTCVWLVARLDFRGVLLPKAVLVPYSTCELLASLVVQLMLAPVWLICAALMPLITGAVVSFGGSGVGSGLVPPPVPLTSLWLGTRTRKASRRLPPMLLVQMK